MRKDAFYFPHDSNAKDDPKCVMLIEQLGCEGYGIYWILVEILREQPDYCCPLSLLGAFARRYNTTLEKMKTVVMSYGLFTVADDKVFFSESLINRMLPLENKRAKARLSAKMRWQKCEVDANAMQTQCERNANPMPKRKEKRREDNNINTIVETSLLPVGNDTEHKIDFNGLQECFNNMFAGKLPKVSVMTDKRKAAIRARMSEHGKQSIMDVFTKVLESSFLLGGNNRDWKCDFDWIFKPTNFIKILEGNYEKSNNTGKTNGTINDRRASVENLGKLADGVLQRIATEKYG